MDPNQNIAAKAQEIAEKYLVGDTQELEMELTGANVNALSDQTHQIILTANMHETDDKQFTI